MIVEDPNTISVRNAFSPVVTATIAIGKYIADFTSKSFDLKDV